jgi:HEAT repeat protein
MAVSVLGWIGGRGVVHTLTELVSALDETSGTRQAASIALGEIGGRKAVEALLGVLRVGGDPDVQVVAANSLGMIGSSRALESLIRIMGDRRHEAAVRGSAAEALGHLRDRRAVPALILAAFEDESAEVRYWATFALGEVGDKWMLPVLEHLAATDDVGSAGWGTVRDEAVAAIDRIRSGFGWQRQP